MLKKLMLIGGIIIIVAGVLSLLFAAFNLHAYYNVLDGSGDLYARLHSRATAFFIIGGVLAVCGTLCVVFHGRV